MPLPSEETTPPVTKMKRVSPGFIGSAQLHSLCRASLTGRGGGIGSIAFGPSRSSHLPRKPSGRGSLGGFEQLARMTAGGVVAVAGRRACARSRRPARRRPPRSTVGLSFAARRVLLDAEVRRGQRGDLRQVGDADHLVRPVRGARRRSPTARAVLPPMPASISSKTSVRCRLADARARSARASSARAPARGGLAAAATSASRDWSRPGARPSRRRRLRSRRDAARARPRDARPPSPARRAPRRRARRAAVAASRRRSLSFAGQPRPAGLRFAEPGLELAETLLGVLELRDLARGSDRHARAPPRSSHRACASGGRMHRGAPRPPRGGRARPRSRPA